MQFRVDVDGTDQAAGEVSELAREFAELAEEAVTASPALQSFAQKAQQLGGAVSQIGGQLGQINPRLGAFVQAVGQAGSAIGAMTTAAGPLGTALAAISAALAIATAAQSAFADESRNAEDAARSETESIQDLAQAFRDAARERQLLRGRLGLGETVDELHQAEDAAEELANRIRRLRREAGQEPSLALIRAPSFAEQQAGLAAFGVQADPFARQARGDDPNSPIGRLIRQREGVLRRIETLRQAENQAAAGADTQEAFGAFLTGTGGRDDQAPRAARERGGRRGEDPWSDEAIDARMGRERAFWLELGELSDAYYASLRDSARSAGAAVADAGETLHQQELARIEERKEKAREEQEMRLAMLDEEKEKAREASEQVRDDAMGVLGPVVKGLTDSLAQVIAGTKSADEAFQGLLASFLEMIAQEAALQAAKEFAEAIAAFARYDYSGGAQHIAAGAAWTGVAIAAGAASVAVAPQASQPASPQQSASNDNGGRGGQTVIVNWNSPVITSGTRAELGRELTSMINESDRRYGAAA